MTLEEHRKLFHERKFRGPLVRINDLTPSELNMVNSLFFEKIRKSGRQWEDLTEIYEIYVGILHDWGIMCPHSDSRSVCTVIATGVQTFTCAFCKTEVIERF